MITATTPLAVDPVSAAQDEARFTVEIESYSSEYAILRVTGELDMTARVALRDTFLAATATTSSILVDMSAVTFIYSGAASMIVDAVAGSQAEVSIFAPTRPVRMILDVLGAGHLVVDSLGDARR